MVVSLIVFAHDHSPSVNRRAVLGVSRVEFMMEG